MISRMFSSFSTKKTGFFWNDINPNVLEAQYAVRGVVPTLATQMQNELQEGRGSKYHLMQNIHSTKSPSVILVIHNNSNKSPFLSIGKSSHVFLILT